MSNLPVRIVLAGARVPSANRLYRSGGNQNRPHLSRRYREWLRVEGIMIAAQWVGPPETGPVAVSIRVPRGARDLDNHAKPILDLLEVAGVIEDDRQVETLYLEWGEQRETPSVFVRPAPAPRESGESGASILPPIPRPRQSD